MTELYMLAGRIPIPVKSQQVWLNWYNAADRTVALTRMGPLVISTQFTGVSRARPPKLFETLIALHDFSDFCWRRYYTWDEALRGHTELANQLYRTRTDDPAKLIDFARALVGPGDDWNPPPRRSWQNRRPNNGARALIHDGIKLN